MTATEKKRAPNHRACGVVNPARIPEPERVRILRKCESCRAPYMAEPWQAKCENCATRRGGGKTVNRCEICRGQHVPGQGCPERPRRLASDRRKRR